MRKLESIGVLVAPSNAQVVYFFAYGVNAPSMNGHQFWKYTYLSGNGSGTGGTWVSTHTRPTNANVRHWLYQHAWLVQGAEFGWWHGAQALGTLIGADRQVESRWGICYRSEAVARAALKQVRARMR